MSVTNKKAMLLGDGWNWIEYDDGSGHLENPNGKSVISFDLIEGNARTSTFVTGAARFSGRL